MVSYYNFTAVLFVSFSFLLPSSSCYDIARIAFPRPVLVFGEPPRSGHSSSHRAFVTASIPRGISSLRPVLFGVGHGVLLLCMKPRGVGFGRRFQFGFCESFSSHRSISAYTYTYEAAMPHDNEQDLRKRSVRFFFFYFSIFFKSKPYCLPFSGIEK